MIGTAGVGEAHAALRSCTRVPDFVCGHMRCAMRRATCGLLTCPGLWPPARRALSANAAAHFEALHALMSALQPSDVHGADGSYDIHMAS